MSDTRRSPQKAAVRTALICGAVAVMMTGAAFAAVPLYEAFCKVTGFGGTPGRAVKASTTVTDREVTIFFNTGVHEVPWTFEPLQRKQTVKVGATNIAFFKVTNKADHAITARAAYNVSPNLAGGHVRKLRCFCFDAQTLQAGETVEFPMIYFLDPGMLSDPDTKGYQDLTFSYTFVSGEPAKATAQKTSAAAG